VKEPAFSDETGTPYVTVCLWREHGDAAWQHGAITFPSNDDDGADWLFAVLTNSMPHAAVPTAPHPLMPMSLRSPDDRWFGL
jgi:hypothetical protein